MNRPYSEATVAMIAEAMHKALDAVDEGWHLSCMDPDGDGSCAKGHYARRMLVEDVAPAVLDALTKAGLLLPEVASLRRAAGHDEVRWDAAARDVVAWVRTQVAEEIAEAFTEWAKRQRAQAAVAWNPQSKRDLEAYARAYDTAATIARTHAGNGFPSAPAALPDVVGTPDLKEG